MPTGGFVTKTINSIKFIKGAGFVVAGCTGDIPAKLFSINNGDCVHSFTNLQKSCFSLDYSNENNLIALGDYSGNI